LLSEFRDQEPRGSGLVSPKHTRPRGSENLLGGAGVDVFKFMSGGSVSSSVNGGVAPLDRGNWLDYSGLTTVVTVNLATGSATGVAGGGTSRVRNIQNVHGGDGGSTLTGNAQGNILIGGAGSDTLSGGTGRSILIGGQGADSVTGGSSSDILIGDSTSWDPMTSLHEVALMAVLAEWQSADSYAIRFHDINTGTGGGLNGTAKLNFGTTVLDDGSADTVTAAVSTLALDWFFLGAGDTSLNL
jgi:RTX calcium-binding nonapeptide repeat (4 copies)